MPKFKFRLQQFVERVATVEVEADNVSMAEFLVRTDLSSSAKWEDGDDAMSVNVMAVYSCPGDATSGGEMSFEYFEVRPCIETLTTLADQAEEGSVDSFRSEAEYEEALVRVDASGNRYKTCWTIYGVDAEGLGFAVADFSTKEGAHEIMNAILAPMARARDLLDADQRKSLGKADLEARVDAASNILEGFINQCSNSDRI